MQFWHGSSRLHLILELASIFILDIWTGCTAYLRRWHARQDSGTRFLFLMRPLFGADMEMLCCLYSLHVRDGYL